MRPANILLTLIAAAPLLACNTVQSGFDGSYAALSAKTEKTVPPARHGKAVHKDAGQYFVEFRSRYALSYGHTFLVHGRLNDKGEIGELSAKNVAGFHPMGDGPEFWTVGHIVPVPAETGPSDGDLEEEYVSARYRVLLSEGEYRRVAAYIKEKQASATPWHAVVYNCNAWVGDVARFMGLKAPDSHWLFPADYINEIRRLNSQQVSVKAGESTASAQ
jgi:hypothetical protein